MRKILLFLVLFVMAGALYGQDMAARSTFSQAEEAYNQNNFREAISLLDQVEKMLGTRTPKTLYLKVVASDKLLKEGHYLQDLDLLYRLVEGCYYYLNNYQESDAEKYNTISEIKKWLEDDGFTLEEAGRLIAKDLPSVYYTGVKLMESGMNNKAAEYFYRCQQGGYKDGANELALYHIYGASKEVEMLGKPMKQNIPAALELLKGQLPKGNATSGALLAFLNLDKTIGTSQLPAGFDTNKAIIRFMATSTGGRVIENYLAARFYEEGAGVSQNLKRAMQLYNTLPGFTTHIIGSDAQFRAKRIGLFLTSVANARDAYLNQNFKRAAEEYLSAHELNVARQEWLVDSTMNAFGALGDQRMVANRISESINAYEQAIKLNGGAPERWQSKLATAKAIERKGQDDPIFQQAKERNSVDAFLSYLSLYPDGKHFEEALKVVERNIIPLAKQNLNSYPSYSISVCRNYLSLFPHGEKSDEAKSIIEKAEKKK